MDTTIAIVDETVTMTYHGIERRRFTVLLDFCPVQGEDPFLTPMYWVEGIGSLLHPFYPLICICGGCETSLALACSDSSGVAFYRSTPNVTCHQNVGFEDGPIEHDRAFTVTVDGNGQLFLSLPRSFTQGALSLFDATGRVVRNTRTTALTSRISCELLGTGIFLAVLTDDNGQRWTTRWVNEP
ncbi:MAG: hypothetical protein IPI81_08575 [Flavobacteriales bacterium]|nr:hypothetical protein [Flavobacteriales bacterium]